MSHAHVKRCSRCETIKSITEFAKQQKAKDGHKSWCRECVRRDNRRRYAANREKHKEQVREWQEKNPEKVKGYKNNYKQRKREEKINNADQKNGTEEG